MSLIGIITAAQRRKLLVPLRPRCDPSDNLTKREDAMTKRGRRKAPEQSSDYDGAWKESARQHFREISERYFPAISATID